MHCGPSGDQNSAWFAPMKRIAIQATIATAWRMVRSRVGVTEAVVVAVVATDHQEGCPSERQAAEDEGHRSDPGRSTLQVRDPCQDDPDPQRDRPEPLQVRVVGAAASRCRRSMGVFAPNWLTGQTIGSRALDVN